MDGCLTRSGQAGVGQRADDPRPERCRIIHGLIEQPRHRAKERPLERVEVAAMGARLQMSADVCGAFGIDLAIEVCPNRLGYLLARQIV